MNEFEVSTTSNDNRIILTGKQLAEVLGVSAPTLSEAAKKGYMCGGYPVIEWVVETETGRIEGYEVPEFLVSDNKTVPQRSNPTHEVPTPPNLVPNKANNGEEVANEVPNIINNSYSLLPESEDYVRPVGMVTIPLIIKKALEQDTPQSRAVIAGGLAGLGALLGHAVSEDTIGAGIGAGAGLAIALLVYKYFDPSVNSQLQEFNINHFINQKPVAIDGSLLSKSGFLPN